MQALVATHPVTKFIMVRFGNVFGSSNSIAPKFRQQIRDGGPVTLTHPETTCYFMTISEAARLFIQSVKIMDLARRMIELSGLTVKDKQNPDEDIEIEITGLPPGERLHEELLIGNNPRFTSHSRILKAHDDFIAWTDLEPKLNALEMVLNVNDVSVIRLMMQQLVSGYTPSNERVDWVYMEQEVEAEKLGLEN